MANCGHNCRCETKEAPETTQTYFPLMEGDSLPESLPSPNHPREDNIQSRLNSILNRNVAIQDRLEVLLGEGSPEVTGKVDPDYSVSEVVDRIDVQTDRISAMIAQIFMKVGSRL